MGRSKPFIAATASIAVVMSSVVPTLAQFHPRRDADDLFNACINQANRNDQVTTRHGTIRYRCLGELAQQYFNFLGEDVEQQGTFKTGFWLFRTFKNGDCEYHVKDASGDAVNTYKCVIDQNAPE
jgi:hypothetical protein